MSADLLAEFGNSNSSSSPQSRQHQPHKQAGEIEQSTAFDPFAQFASPEPALTSSQNATRSALQPSNQSVLSSNSFFDVWGDISSLTAEPLSQVVPQGLSPNDDDWGDFESATPAPLVASQESGRTRVVRASTMDIVNNTLVDIPAGPSQKVPGPSWAKPTSTQARASLAHSTAKSVPIRKPTEEIFNNLNLSERKFAKVKIKPKLSAHEPDANVLFDADDFELTGEPEDEDEDDEFGDFEGTIASTQPVGRHTGQDTPGDLLNLDIGAPMAPTTQPSGKTGPSRRTGPPFQLKSQTEGLSPIVGEISPKPPLSHALGSPPSSQKHNPVPELSLSTRIARPTAPTLTESPMTAWPSFGQVTKDRPACHVSGRLNPLSSSNSNFDEWSSFDDFPPSGPQTSVQKKKADLMPKASLPKFSTDSKTDSWDWDPEPISENTSHGTQTVILIPDPVTASPKNSPGPPPTNIPPPSILLSILPQLLRLPVETLFRPSTRLSGDAKATLLTHPQTIAFLQGYIALATVTAHILAGRRIRWSRDRLLTSKMSISIAGAKGMKLSNIDKAESAREAREAEEVLIAWKEIVGSLRTACAGTGAGFKVPEITDKLPITTVKGGFTAPKACLVCGLKREERVSKVDVNVEDSFGEWWVEHWGHRTCRNFWIQQEYHLRLR